MKRLVPVAVAVMLLGACGGAEGAAQDASSSTSSPSSSTETPVLEKAANACQMRSALGDGSKSLTVDVEGDDALSGDHSYEDLGCILRETAAPDYVIDHIGATRALDGMQDDTWGDIEARWTYHPDEGHNITFIDRS